MSDCPLSDPPPAYDPEFLVDSWLEHPAAHEQAHNVARFARYAPELGWQSILTILELPDAQSHLSALADALDMLISRYGARFIDRIEAEAKISAPFKLCLAEVSPSPTFPLPNELWPRLSAAAGVPLGPMAPHMVALYSDMPDLSEVATWDPNPLAPEDVPALSQAELAAQAHAWVVYHQTFWAWEELERPYREEGLDAAWPLLLGVVEKATDEALAHSEPGFWRTCCGATECWSSREWKRRPQQIHASDTALVTSGPVTCQPRFGIASWPHERTSRSAASSSHDLIRCRLTRACSRQAGRARSAGAATATRCRALERRIVRAAS